MEKGGGRGESWSGRRRLGVPSVRWAGRRFVRPSRGLKPTPTRTHERGWPVSLEGEEALINGGRNGVARNFGR